MKPRRILVIGAGVSGMSIARGLLRDGHDVTVYERRPDVAAGGGAVTIWPNGATVLRQLGVDMTDAGQQLSTVRVLTSTGRPLATFDVSAVADKLGAPVRMVPRRVLLERIAAGLPAERIQCNARVVALADTQCGIRVTFEDGSVADGDAVIAADGLHSVVRDIVAAPPAASTGWSSWQGLARLPAGHERRVDKQLATIVVGERGSVGMWPAGGSHLQWWFDLPWSADFIRPERPIEMIRANFSGWSDAIDRVLAILTDEDLAQSPFPHFRHPIPAAGTGPVTLIGDAAHTMPPTVAQGANQALLDTMVLRQALSDAGDSGGLTGALRRYENTRRSRVGLVSRVASLQVSHSEAMLRPAALIPDRAMTQLLALFLRATSHRGLAAHVDSRLEFRAPVQLAAGGR